MVCTCCNNQACHQLLLLLLIFLSKHKIGSFTTFSFNNHHNNLYSLWHSRLGYPSDVKLQSLSNVFPFLQNCCAKQCTVCPLAKQKRLPFPFNNKMCDFPFDLVHMDVWGPFSIPTSNVHRYFLTLVDDATRATWLFLMKAKSEVKALIVSFYNMLLTQFNVKIKCFRSDNALEFKLSNFYSTNDVIHQTSCVYIPQQNSVVERKHQHILSIGRALQIQSNLPLSFWGDCVLTAVHLINRLSSPLLQHKLPTNFYLAKFLLIPILGVLVAYVCYCHWS